MKCRTGFVSNSSSCSFIVINNSNIRIPELINNNKSELNVPQDFGGNTEFGWEEIRYYDFGSKLNFAYLQTTYVNEHISKKWIEMLEKILKDNLHINIINWNLTTEYNNKEKFWGYIDHQSCASEGGNIEIFDSETDLYNFLFSSDSYIQGDNDNK